MEEKDFLQGYEIRPWEFSPRIYKIIAAAAVFNILGLVLLAQTNIMSASACESPFVKNVCSVLDTVYVGSKLLSNEKDYVVKDYNRTEIQDPDVVWVDTTKVEPQLAYPAGYFQIANKDEIERQRLIQEMQENGFSTNPTNPTIVPNNPSPAVKPTPKYIPPAINRSNPTRRGGGSSSDNIAKKTQKLPDQKDKVTTGEINDDLLSGNRDNNDTDKNPIKDKSVNNSDSVKDDYKDRINKKPLQDFADDIVDKWAKKEIDLNQPFVVKFTGKLSEDGRIIPKKFSFDESVEQGDEKIKTVAKAAILAVGDSGWFSYLTDLDVKEVTITLIQDNDKLFARVESKAKSQNEARTIASGLNSLISITRQTIKLGEDETKLLNAAKTPTFRGDVFILDLEMTKPEAQEMMNRKLNEAWAKKQKEKGSNQNPAQPNGTAKQNDPKDNAVK